MSVAVKKSTGSEFYLGQTLKVCSRRLDGGYEEYLDGKVVRLTSTRVLVEVQDEFFKPLVWFHAGDWGEPSFLKDRDVFSCILVDNERNADYFRETIRPMAWDAAKRHETCSLCGHAAYIVRGETKCMCPGGPSGEKRIQVKRKSHE